MTRGRRRPAAVHAEHGNPQRRAARRLADRRGSASRSSAVDVRRARASRRCELRFAGDEPAAHRPAGRVPGHAVRAPGSSDRQLPLKRRELGDLLAEELRRLDADQPYADALSAVTGEKGLDERPPMRTLIWRDPAPSGRCGQAGDSRQAGEAGEAAQDARRRRQPTKAAPKPAAKSAAKSATTKRTGTKAPARKAATGKKKSAT